jgi:hypothetical protein
MSIDYCNRLTYKCFQKSLAKQGSGAPDEPGVPRSEIVARGPLRRSSGWPPPRAADRARRSAPEAAIDRIERRERVALRLRNQALDDRAAVRVELERQAESV